MKQYLELLEDVLTDGVHKENRTGVDTIELFGKQIKYDLSEGFPLLTTKKVSFNSVASELLWFIEGSNNERRLAEILYGKDYTNKKTIWTENANSEYWKTKSQFVGDLGRVYGVQMRTWTNYKGEEIDQIKNLVYNLKHNPDSRRHILLNYNPGELDEMALPACHMLAQFNITNNKLNCFVFIRSNDLPLGHPYNVASYALLTNMIAKVLDLELGILTISIGSAHIYVNQIGGVAKQLKRTPAELPNLLLPKKESILDYKLEDFKIVNYFPQKQINFPFTV